MSFCFFWPRDPTCAKFGVLLFPFLFPPILCQQLPACFSAVGIMELEEGFL